MSTLTPFLRPLLGAMALALFVANLFVSLSRTTGAPAQEPVLVNVRQVAVPAPPCDLERVPNLEAEVRRATQELERTLRRTARLGAPVPAVAPCPQES